MSSMVVFKIIVLLLLLLLLSRFSRVGLRVIQRRQPTRLLCPWDSQGKNTGVGCHFLLQYVWQRSTQYCKAIFLQLKINKFKKCPWLYPCSTQVGGRRWPHRVHGSLLAANKWIRFPCMIILILNATRFLRLARN